MNVVTLERVFPAKPERIFKLITQPENMIRWWGHHGMIVPDADLNFSRLGPWYSILESTDGSRRTVSGVVTEIDPPRRVSFTWAWHNDNNERGHESRVTIELSEAEETGTKLILQHFDLPSDEARKGHVAGWTAIFDKLQKGLADAGQN